MGKGDRRSKRGKIWRGSFGNARPARPDAKEGAGTKSTKKTAAKAK